MITTFSHRLLLILLLTSLFTALSRHAASADVPLIQEPQGWIPTQEHQDWCPTTYVPLKRHHVVGGQPIVQTTLNGTQPAAFLMDTGGEFSILSSEMAKRLNLKQKPAFLDNGTPALFQGKQTSAVSISTLKIGILTITVKGNFINLDDKNFMLFPNKDSDDTPYDGIIGANILEHYAVLVDASQKSFGLCLPGNLSMGQVGQLGYTSGYVIPIFQKDGYWCVTVQLTNNGISQSEDMVLDTGSNITTISDTTAAHLGLKITDEQRTTNLYSNNVPMGKSSVDTLQIGGITLSGHHVSVAHVSKLEPPVLGMDILSGYRVLIDFPGKKMYLQSNTAAAVPTITVGPAPAPAVPPAK